MAIAVDPHPLLDPIVFETNFRASLVALSAESTLFTLLTADAKAPVSSSDDVRGAVRDLLRQGGYKPTGRGKPASEYLLRAVGEGALRSINPAVDACNAASYHSGLPISVVDLDKAKPPFRLGLAPAGTTYVFNPAGQTIDVAGLLCLFDADGPCANAVKDSQRTKTDDQTQRTLTVIWGTRALPEYTQRTFDWYQSLLLPFARRLERY
jgi:DNA/RNA-binding domain of Phe-tRNA-synthetase-like protein